jgi:hypothetical protein
MGAEQITQQRILLQYSKGPVRLWRNNVGTGWAGRADRATPQNLRALAASIRPGDVVVRQARPLHAGLCVGSSDLIGFRTRPDGIAQFVALEVKSPTGRPTKEQTAFLDHITQAGGCAGVVRSITDADTVIHSAV